MEGAIDPRPMRKWTIQVFYDVQPDKGPAFRATACYQGEGKDIKQFIESAEKAFEDRSVKFGAFLPGWHERLP